MKLTYDILWFEDQFNAIRPTIDRLCGAISNKGLIPKIHERNSISSNEIYELADTLDKNNPYDLIIFDYDMGASAPSGVEIAKELRANIYTDMVFYSGKNPSQIDEIVFKQKIQGVFVIHKPNFFNEIFPLISDHIKKISSLNGARGMIMSEWSEIELSLRTQLSKKLNELDEPEKQKHLSKIGERLLRQITDKKGRVENASDILALIEDPFLCDFSIIRRSLGKIDTGSDLYKDDAELHKFQSERNILAHNKHAVNDDGSISIRHPKGENIYHHGEFERLRKALIELKQLILL